MTMLLCLAGILAPAFSVAPNPYATLEELLDMIPASAPFTEWLESSGELPPDFSSMASHAPVQQPLAPVIDGETVSIDTISGWRGERERLLELLHHWIMGSVPPPPDNLVAEVLDEQNLDGVRIREVELRFGPEHKARLWLQLYIPEGPGPFPIFMTQDNHRGWAQIALRRGYIACVYAGSDSRDDTDTFLEAWPEHDWSRLLRRGWAAGRCLDYLETVPEADVAKNALTGHSRNGKSALMGAAVDERIAVVISSSSGVGGALPSRYAGETEFTEGIEHITRRFPDWFHPRWRFFIGREHKVPVDLHHLTALSAPRPCLLSIALNDNVEHTWALQHTYLSAKPVYALHDAEASLRILWRSGGHETWTEVIERYLDWCDRHFGRGDFEFEETFVFPWDWDGWRDRAVRWQEQPGEEAEASALETAVRTILGEEPPRSTVPNMTYGILRDRLQSLYGRSAAGRGLERDELVFGEYINGDVYLPEGVMDRDEKIPGILYLPSFCAPGGYSAAYRRGEQAYRTLARAGHAVFCFDPIGSGRRVDESALFYERHPDWSLLGKMVRDATVALDAMQELAYIDPENIWVVGYGTGAFTAVHLAALDSRPVGYGLVCPPLPFHLDTDILETGGIERWAQASMLLPRLGVFTGREADVPYDIDGILAAQAPKPLVLVTPTHDRFAPPDKAGKALASVRQAYEAANATGHLVQVSPETYNHFDESMQRIVVDEIKRFRGDL